MKRALAVVLLCLFAPSCGDSSSPTSPTNPTPSTPTRIIGLAGNMGFGNVLVGQTATTSLTITNSGNTALTITGMTVPAGGVYGSTFVSGTIAPGASQAATVRFSPSVAQSYNGTLTVNGDQTSGTNTIGISGTGTLPLATVAGVVREASGAAVSGALVRIGDGAYVGRSSTTDGNGYYSIPGVAGTFSLVISSTGFDTLTRAVTVSGDTSFNVTINRTASTPTPTGRYRVGALCNNGTISDATGSGACSSNGGVRCWRYNDGSCTNP